MIKQQMKAQRDVRHLFSERAGVNLPRPTGAVLTGVKRYDAKASYNYTFDHAAMTDMGNASDSRFDGSGIAAREKACRCPDCGAPRTESSCGRCGSTDPPEYR